MTSHDHHHSHRPIVGLPGELVDLFMALVDRESQLEPHWWHTYGSFTLLNFTAGFFPPDMSRADAMTGLREVLEYAINRGQVSEDFLVKALKRELDDYVHGKQDPAQYNARVDKMRETMQNVIDDPIARDRWRRAMASSNPEWATKSDAEVIGDARKALENSVTTRHLSPDDVAARWAEAGEWWDVAGELLPDHIFEHWAYLKNKRDIDDARKGEG